MAKSKKDDCKPKSNSFHHLSFCSDSYNFLIHIFAGLGTNLCVRRKMAVYSQRQKSKQKKMPSSSVIQHYYSFCLIKRHFSPMV